MSEIIIPERLAIRLSHDKTWDSCVTKLKEYIEPLLAKGPDFFPDYTIHGIDHINRCLDIADHLIDFDTLSEEPKKTDLLTPRDVAFLVCGIMLHDMGMFLRPDGVRKLVQMDRTDDAFGGKPWKDEWSDYVDRTKRLSQEKMRYHFGKVIPVTEDCVNHTDTDDNKRIIGEFLRQHHPRQAHELALSVLPGSIDTDLFKNTNLKEKDRKLIGILARSHGMDIRDTEDYVNKHIGKGPKPYNTPIFYLMTVLRTADALDADERRAPEALEQQQNIPVPISVEEWTWNQCIDPDGCDWLKEQKNRHIEADPKSSPQYVQLDKWLKGIQADLDLCWSILAEKYPYDRYRLSIHRVVSNIHEPGIRETMNEKFLTKEAKITANPEIVKLMMEPLYGNDPTYGVRELLQNAVDACLEREHWEKNHGNPNYKGLVDIRIENGTFTITDNGMGMNEDVLLNYYLSAGSSYRSSDAWMAANAPNGKSQVARTGKFGVGFLASFLLGNEVEVCTKHRADMKGYYFTFDQESRPLDIQRADRINPYAAEVSDSSHAGTTITIKLKATAIRGFYSNNYNYPWYNWYAFDEPKVRYFIGNKKLHHEKLCLCRDPDKNEDWLELSTKDYESYQWHPNWMDDNSEFYCNGIRIYDGFPIDLGIFGLTTPIPHISVIDKKGILDVTLSRQSLRFVPEATLLYQEIFRWHIARLLLIRWDTEEQCRNNCADGFLLHAGRQEAIPFLLSPNGFTLNCSSTLSALAVTEYVILHYEGEYLQTAFQTMKELLTRSIPYTIVTQHTPAQTNLTHSVHLEYMDSPGGFVSSLLHGSHTLFKGSIIGYQTNKYTDSIWLEAKVYLSTSDKLSESIKFPYSSGYALGYDGLHDDCIIFSHDPYSSLMPFRKYSFNPYFFPVAVHIVLDLKHHPFLSLANSLFTQALREALVPEPSYPDQSLWIPFDMEERKKKFPKAFEELKVYMDHIRKYPVE